MAIEIRESVTKERNEQRYRCGADQYPCAVCGKPCNPNGGNAAWVHMDEGGMVVLERADIDAHGPHGRMGTAGCLGSYPIGQTCLRKFSAAERKAVAWRIDNPTYGEVND